MLYDNLSSNVPNNNYSKRRYNQQQARKQQRTKQQEILQQEQLAGYGSDGSEGTLSVNSAQSMQNRF